MALRNPPANGKEIIRLRRAKGIRQKDLAKAAGLTRMTIYNLEHNGPATPFTIRQVAECLNVDPQTLIQGRPPNNDYLQEPPTLSEEWMFFACHARVKYDDFDAVAFEDAFRAFLDKWYHSVYVTRLRPAHSVIIEMRVPTAFLHVIIVNFASSLSPCAKPIDTIFLSPEGALHLISQYKSPEPGLFLVNEYKETQDFSKPEYEYLLPIYYPMLSFKVLPNNIIAAKRRLVPKRSAKQLSP
jgi:transcriptional regulator with XRE-family HTH domain